MTLRNYSLENLGLNGTAKIWNPSPPVTVEAAIRRNEGWLTPGGAFLAVTSPFTGRSPRDKFIVREPGSESKVWWGAINQPIDPGKYEVLHTDVLEYLKTKELYIRVVSL